jgi:hypothetical protein
MNSFWSYFLGFFYKPRSTFTRLLSDPRQLSLGLKSVLLMSILYTLTTLGYVVAGASPLMPPVIGIPAKSYYLWELFFQIPVFFLGWLLASGLAQALNKLFKGNGTFQEHLAVLGFALNTPWYITWLVDTIIALLYLLHVITQEKWAAIIAHAGTWQAFNYSYPLVALIWLFFLVALALRAVQKLKWWQIVINSAISVIVLQVVMTIFVR